MSGRLSVLFVVIFLSLLSSNVVLNKRCNKLTKERNRYQQTTASLLGDVKRLQVDSSTMALDVVALRLSVEEFTRYRSEDAEKIKKMGVEIRNLKAAARHTVEVNAPLDVALKDTVIMRDTVLIPNKLIHVDTPYIKVEGVIENDRLTGWIFLPISLQQAIWIEYKHRFLWWRWKIKAIHQTISCDNPHAEISYTEMILIDK